MLIQIFAIVILFALCVYALRDFKNAVLLWLPFKLLFNNQIAVRYSSPGMALVIAGDLALIMIYFLKRKELKNLYEGDFIIKPIVIAYVLTYILVFLFSTIPFSTQIVPIIKFFCSGFCMVFLAHKVFTSQEDIFLFVKYCTIVAFLITILALSENLLRTNLWLDFVFYNSPYDPSANRMFYIPGHMEIRYGFVRSRSFFSFHIPFGFACSCLFWMISFFYINHKEEFYKKIYYYAVFLLGAGVFMSNSKQVYLGLFVMFLSLYPLKSIFNVRNLLVFLCIVCFVLICFPDYLNNIFSLFDEELAEEGGGSTIEGREQQMDIAFEMFGMNPISGNGIGAIDYFKSKGQFLGIHGAESLFLRILPELGCIGLICYFYSMLYLTKLRDMIPSKELNFFLISILVVETTGGLKDISIWLVCLLAVYRFQQLKSLCKNE